MHMLHLLRHAKSSWKDDVEDHQRRLSRRGREAARRIARHISGAIGVPDLVLCSSALRARETLELVLAEYAAPPRIAIEDRLYAASRENLTDRLRLLAEEDADVLLIGHNPGLHELAVAVADPSSPGYHDLACGKFPTAARASFRISGNWSTIGYGNHQLIDYVTAESLPGGKR